MSWLVGILIAIVLLAMTGGGDPNAARQPAPTVPSSAALTVPNPGFAPHCNYGPNDNDVRGVVRAATPKLPDC